VPRLPSPRRGSSAAISHAGVCSHTAPGRTVRQARVTGSGTYKETPKGCWHFDTRVSILPISCGPCRVWRAHHLRRPWTRAMPQPNPARFSIWHLFCCFPAVKTSRQPEIYHSRETYHGRTNEQNRTPEFSPGQHHAHPLSCLPVHARRQTPPPSCQLCHKSRGRGIGV
jgi:hypothetical protein